MFGGAPPPPPPPENLWALFCLHFLVAIAGCAALGLFALKGISRVAAGFLSSIEKLMPMQVKIEAGGEPISFKRAMPLIVQRVRHEGKANPGYVKFEGDARSLVMGAPDKAALGIESLLKISSDEYYARLARGVEAIEEEVRASGNKEMIECLDYVLHCTAGVGERADIQFSNGKRDRGRRGETFEYFCSHPDAAAAELSRAHVLALRLYTTAAFRPLNQPLRFPKEGEPHPFPATIAFISDGIKKLRAVEAKQVKESEDVLEARDLWRGMCNLEITKEFFATGGTEFAPMSTTDDIAIAVQYSAGGGKALLLKVKTNSFMERGANLQFLSAFPEEKEFLFPPLTYMQPTGRRQSLVVGQVLYTVVEVKPQM